MRKLSVLIIAVLSLSMIMCSMSFAAEPEYEYDTLVNWDIQIASPEGTAAVLQEDEYYIYPMGEGIPYVMVTTYTGFKDVNDEEEFIDLFTEYMSENYPDLEVVSEPVKVDVDGTEYFAVNYSYTVQGYEVSDIRVIRTLNDRFYMFASKEIPELDLMVGDLLEEVIANSVYLKDGKPVVPEGGPEETDDIPEIYWEDQFIEDLKEEGIDGEFITLEDVGLEMFMVSDLQSTPLPEQQPDPESYLGFYAADADYSQYILIQHFDLDMSIDEYLSLVESIDGTADAARCRINGIDFISYTMPDDNLLCLSTIIEGRGLTEFSFYPSDDDEFLEIAEIIGSSIRPAQD